MIIYRNVEGWGGVGVGGEGGKLGEGGGWKSKEGGELGGVGLFVWCGK